MHLTILTIDHFHLYFDQFDLTTYEILQVELQAL